MYNYTVSTIIGFIAMCFAIISYFLKNKSLFLMAQAGAIVFLGVSCMFIEEYYAMISYGINFARVLTFYILERKDRAPSIWLILFFMFLLIACFVILNVFILEQFKTTDIILMVANLLYSYAFAIRNLTLLRYVFLLPLSLSVIYYVLIHGTVFVIISYSFELCANVVAITYNTKYVQRYVNKVRKKS